MAKQTIEHKIKEIVNKIAAEYKPEKIILFGSFAWGKPNKDSDIDLLVVKKTEESSRKLAQKIDESLFEREMPIDILVYSPKYLEERLSLGDLFIKNIIKNGKLLYATK